MESTLNMTTETTERLSQRHTWLSRGVSLFALAAVMAPSAVIAQDGSGESADADDGETFEEIIVTGFRKSLQDTIALKRHSSSIVEAISAEDIGKLPDVSIAESLARLPGLAGQRTRGRTSVISIRGMSPDFSTTLLNGREQASSGDNRAVEFDQYPSELINSVVVYKTPDAAVVGMGLSGSVDLRTVRPLAHGEQAIVFNLRGEVNSLDKLNSDVTKNGWRGSFSYIDQFMDDTVGIAVGYAHLETPTQIQHHKAWWWAGASGALPAGSPDDAIVLNGQEVAGINRDQTRDGVMAVLEWQPSNNFHTIIDAYYSEFKQEETLRGVYWFSSPATGQGLQILNPTFTEFGSGEFASTVVDSGVSTNITPVIRNDFNTRDDKLFAIGMNNEFSVGSWDITTDLSYSSSKRKEQILEAYAGIAPIGTVDTIAFDIPEFGFPTYDPGLDYSDRENLVLGDPAPWGGWGQDAKVHYPDLKEDVWTVALNAQRDLSDSMLGGFFSSVQFGVNYTTRSKDKDVSDNKLQLKNDRANIQVDEDLIIDPVNLGFAGFAEGSLSYQVMPSIERYYDLVPTLNANRWDKAWGIDEKLLTFHVKMNVDTEMFGLPVLGNIGGQVVHTDQKATGFFLNSSDLSSPQQSTGGSTYTNFLPSVNFAFDLGNDYQLRLGAAKTQARPRMDDMRASVGAGVGATTRRWVGAGGNPELQPWRATSFDISFEKYFGVSSYVSVAGFYKTLDSYIRNEQIEFDFSNAPNNSNIVPVSNIGIMTRPTNGEGGNMRGIEISGSLDGVLFADFLEGFGIVGSQSWTWTSVDTDGDGTFTPLPGLSDSVSNLTIYYENDGFSARVSQRYRSGWKGEVVELFATTSFPEIFAETIVDAQVSYSPQSGFLEGATFLLQVNNLTNEPYITRFAQTRASGGTYPETYEKYGRQIMFGINYKM
ncbi:MAG: TonB-dependent receptor [Kordiimonadaceae bacterium]|nr:TonB-dependent receptor [Kordiimonadaceae bacterium]